MSVPAMKNSPLPFLLVWLAGWCLALPTHAGTPVLLTAKEAKEVLPPVITPEENPWHLSAGLFWRQMEGLSTKMNIETDLGFFARNQQTELDGPGAFLMLESPALLKRGPAALTFSLMYSWAGMDDLNRAYELPGRTVWQQFSLDLHTVSIGPRFTFETPKVRLSSSAGFAMNWARWQTTSIMTRIPPGALLRASNGASDTYLPGFYLDAIAQVRLTKKWSVLLGGRYDWVSSASSMQTRQVFGNSVISVQPKLSGWSALVGLTYQF